MTEIGVYVGHRGIMTTIVRIVPKGLLDVTTPGRTENGKKSERYTSPESLPHWSTVPRQSHDPLEVD